MSQTLIYPTTHATDTLAQCQFFRFIGATLSPVVAWRRKLPAPDCVVSLTKDTVPVSVDAVLFWVAWDAQKAALEVRNYEIAVDWAAQTALRDIIGKMPLADILVGREAEDVELRRIIDERTTPWGVSSVEILSGMVALAKNTNSGDQIEA